MKKFTIIECLCVLSIVISSGLPITSLDLPYEV